jgi:hypothetical protein
MAKVYCCSNKALDQESDATLAKIRSFLFTIFNCEYLCTENIVLTCIVYSKMFLTVTKGGI